MRNTLVSLAIFGAIISVTVADVHRLYVGNVNPPAVVYALAFEDVTSEVFRMNNITAASTHDWITLNHDKTHLYGASLNSSFISSYTVRRDNLSLDRTVALNGSCQDKRTAFVMASSRAPYRVYPGFAPGQGACGAVLDADTSGALTSVRYTWSYTSVRGVAVGNRLLGNCSNSSSELVYSVDSSNDALWTHEASADGVVRGRARMSMTFGKGAHPGQIVAHPGGGRLYVLMEATNQVLSFLIDPRSGIPLMQEGSFTLLPSNISSSEQYISTDLALSHNASYLWATTRAQDTALDHGYVHGLQLNAEGRIIKRMFSERTPSTVIAGGVPNAVAPTTFTGQFVGELAAVTTIRPGKGGGNVQFWRMTDGVSSLYGMEYRRATMSGWLGGGDDGCCANAVWVN